MSFSSNSKAEICKLPTEQKCCSIAECYGILLYGNTFNSREIRLITGSRIIGQRIIDQFKNAFSLDFDIHPAAGKTGKQSYIINSSQKIKQIFETYGLPIDKLLAHHVNLSVLEEECCCRSFIRGTFLTGGAITDPTKSYHLELVTDRYNVSKQTFSLLSEMDFRPKETSRSGNYIIYFKQSAAIEDFLTFIGAPLHAMKLMSTKIEKDVRNVINRKVNCDTANVSKTVDAAVAQISAINLLKDNGKFIFLPEKLKITADLRARNPELSIKELAELFTPAVSKSCLNHRLRKLVEMSKAV